MLVKTGDAQILEVVPEKDDKKELSKGELLADALERAKTVVKPKNDGPKTTENQTC